MKKAEKTELWDRPLAPRKDSRDSREYLKALIGADELRDVARSVLEELEELDAQEAN